MKKIFTILVGLWLVCSGVLARTVEEAAVIASGFMSQKGTTETVTQRVRMAKNAGVVSPQVSLEYTQATTDNKDAVYVFNHTNGGFVWVSASDYSHEVLGYSDSGSFDKNNIPDNMQYWLRMYAGEIARVDANPPALAANQQISTTYPVISPLLGNVIWGQDAPFNNLCPTMDGASCPTGCVATAVSQIMYKHKHPTKGTGSFSYTTSDGVSASANFAKTTYDWDRMLPDYSLGYTSSQASAVATLLYHVGVASQMSYGVNVSGAHGQTAMNGLINYFDYDADITVWQKDFHLDDERIMQAIATDLQADRPVYMEAYTVNQEGHAFLCDGMQSDGYLHINWGWNGLSNGYFALSALDPELQGTGGSSGNYAFNVQVAVYTGIQPDRGGVAKPLMTADKFTRTSADIIPRDESVEFTIEFFCNRGVGSNVGQLMYCYYDANNNLVDYVTLSDISELAPLAGWYDYYVWGIVPTWMPDGDYELEIGCLNSQGYYHPVYVWKEGAARFPFTISGNTIRFESATPNPPAVSQYFDFEDATQNSQWQLNGQDNFWTIGTAAGSVDGGSKAMYITYDDDHFAYYGYSVAISWAYIPVSLQVGDNISFYWKGEGENGYDYLNVYLVPQSESLYAGNFPSDNALLLHSKLSGSNDWQQALASSPVSGDYHLCFMWCNDASVVGATPIAIDNVQIGDTKTPTHYYDFTIRVKKAANCDMDISNGVWLWWWNTGQDGQWASTTLDNDGWYTATVRSTESTINCLFATYNDWSIFPDQTEDLSNITGDVCLQIGDRNSYSQYTLNELSCSNEEPLPCYTVSVNYSDGGYAYAYPARDCYYVGTEVEISAYANEGYEFSYWSTGETSPYITISVYGDVEITAYFTPVEEPVCYTLSVSAIGEGDVEYYPYNDCYEEGEEVTLYAYAHEGYVFSHWSDGNTSAIRTLAMDRNYQLQAIFVDASSAYDVKNLKLTNSKLNITAKWESIATRFEVTITNKDDEVVNTEVVELQDANKVYKYKVSKYGKYTVTVKPVDADNQPIGEEASKTITLVRKYSLYISSGIGGTVNEEVNGDYAYETSVEIIATAREGYEFFKWSDGNTSAIRTLIMDQDYELVAYFNQKDVAVEDVCADVTVAVEYRTIIVESTQSQDFALYDVVGRLIERQAHTDIANFTVPSAGLYLLRTNNGFVKVRVK